MITPSFAELTRAFWKIGLTSFGGPAGQIALMHRELVDERKWVSEADFLHALNFCHLLPGPEAQQLATWIGWRLHGMRGGLMAGLLFVIPGAGIILVLSMLYAYAAHLDWFASLFLGIKAAVLSIVVQALMRIAGRALDTWLKRGLALAAFAGLFLFKVPFPLIVLGAAAFGAIVASAQPDWLGLKPVREGMESASPPPWGATVKAVAIWLLVWMAPMGLILVLFGQNHVLWDIGLFFSKLAVVTFGGAYAVLSYMAQQAVEGFGWLKPGEMADGLGLAETTPGPLILVTQFVGFLAAFRAPEPFAPLVAGVIGASLTLWVTFAPCFLWIFGLAPWIDRLQNVPRLKGALAAVTASVVGVIANLTLWFAVHVLGISNDPASLNGRAILIAALAGVMVFGLKWGLIRILVISAVFGLVAGQL